MKIENLTNDRLSSIKTRKFKISQISPPIALDVKKSIDY
jgi:hypothetical protein